MGIFGFEHGGSRRYATLVEKLIASESADAPLPPGFILELDRPEWSYHKRELLWTTGPIVVAAGGAGNFSRMQVAIAKGSKRIVVVTYATALNVGATGACDLSELGAIIAAGLVQNSALDERVALNVAGTARQVTSTNGIDNTLNTTTGIILDRKSSGAASADIVFTPRTSAGLPFIMLPGGRLEIVQRLAATAATFLMAGYERPATDDELAA